MSCTIKAILYKNQVSYTVSIPTYIVHRPDKLQTLSDYRLSKMCWEQHWRKKFLNQRSVMNW